MLEISQIAPAELQQETGEQLLTRVAEAMAIVADLSRADALLYRLEGGQRARIVAQARANSVPPIWPESIVGSVAYLAEDDALSQAAHRRRAATTSANHSHANIVRIVYPVLGAFGEPVGLLAFDRTLIQDERQRHRQPTFREAILELQRMAARGELYGADKLSPFSEHDGILVVDRDLRIQYASGLATSIYNRAGFMRQLDDISLHEIPYRDAALAAHALTELTCTEEEEQRPEGHFWVKKAIPLIGYREPRNNWRRWTQIPQGARGPVGVIIAIHDATEEQRRARELKLKTEMLLELQHRVRNSLQTIIALLRMQARRAESAETRMALEESISRILSVSAVHEFLFDPNERRVNLRALSERLVTLLKPLVPPPLVVEFHVEGSDVFIPGERATPAALVISELVLNAVEHAFEGQPRGNVWVKIGQRGNTVELEVRDDGQGAPQGFSPDMGLALVNTLTREGLQGEFDISNNSDGGAVAQVRFQAKPVRRSGAAV